MRALYAPISLVVKCGESLDGEGVSSIGRVAVSKTVGWGFESLTPCQPSLGAGRRAKAATPNGREGGRRVIVQKSSELRLGKPACQSRRGGRVVYRGGLENRFPRKRNGGSNPSLSASLRSQRSGE